MMISTLTVACLAASLVAQHVALAGPTGRSLSQVGNCGSLRKACCNGFLQGDSFQCPSGWAFGATQNLACKQGTCVNCGKRGQPCCQQFTTSEPSCSDGNLCLSGSCKACGALGQACCTGAGATLCKVGGACSAGKCVQCGGLGQPCCPNDSSNGDVRRSCGFAGNAMCLRGVCTACGRPGEPCCTGDGNGRITGSGTDVDDFVCWSGAACPKSRKCPSKPVPAASRADRRVCSANYEEALLLDPGQFFDACVGAAANTECKDTVLARRSGSPIVPDWCIDYSNRKTPSFDCPAKSASAKTKYVYCAESTRTAECGNDFCTGGALECEKWSPWAAGPSALFLLKPGTAAVNGNPPVYMPALACDGSLQILSRPGLSSSLYSIVINSELQTVPICIFQTPCIEAPLQITPVFGTTIAWAATPGVPTSKKGVISKASATVVIQDLDGLACLAPGVSRVAQRTQYELTCLLLDSPDDVPSGPLFP